MQTEIYTVTNLHVICINLLWYGASFWIVKKGSHVIDKQNFKVEFVSCTDLSIIIAQKHPVQGTHLFHPSIHTPAHHLVMVKIIKYWLFTHRTAHDLNT